MKTIIGIDPGPVESAYVVWDGETISSFGKTSNKSFLLWLTHGLVEPADEMVIEKVACYGMAVGDPVFDTVLWTGFFCHAWRSDWEPGSEHDIKCRIPRLAVKMHICHDSRAKDGNIIQALKDRFEPGLLPRQRPKVMLKGISADVWQALALAVTWYDLNVGDNENVHS